VACLAPPAPGVPPSETAATVAVVSREDVGVTPVVYETTTRTVHAVGTVCKLAEWVPFELESLDRVTTKACKCLVDALGPFAVVTNRR
jgi:hypothetical protein